MPDTPEKSSPRPAPESELRLVGPTASVAPAAHDTGEANTIVLFPVPLEFLCVQVTFHRGPVVGLRVRFTTLEGAQVADGLLTDASGRVSVARRVFMGAYVCELEHQAPVRVYTMPALERGFPVALPVGRFYRDLCERAELPTRTAKTRRTRVQTRA
jgi:hypothetical protein